MDDKVLVVFLPECHESLAGIIAGRLREHFHKPSFVLTRGETTAKGSGRSIEQYHMYQGLCKVSDLLVKFGGHPMAGSEKTGIENAKALLLENAYYVLTPAAKVTGEMIERYRDLVASLKAIPLILTYEKHDYVTAAISHLPHIIASSLVNLVKDCDYEDGTMKKVAAGGFKDITRIASSSPEMWEQICSANSENILSVLDEYINSLIEIKFSLAEHNTNCIHDLFETSRDYRNSISDSGSGPIPKAYSIYCDMVDEAGGIAALATILATNGISIKNIGIVHNREFEEAVLHVEFYEEMAKIKAAELLRKYRYTIYER